jgi:hypothetical protein
MRSLRWLVMVGWQVCLGTLSAQVPGLPPGRSVTLRPGLERPWLPGTGLWRWLGLNRPEPSPPRDCPGPCLATLSTGAAGFIHWHGGAARSGGGPTLAIPGARNLVLEVRRIELDDPFGTPRGTYR